MILPIVLVNWIIVSYCPHCLLEIEFSGLLDWTWRIPFLLIHIFLMKYTHFPLFSYGWGCLSYTVCSIALSISWSAGLVVMTAFIGVYPLKLFFLLSHFPLSSPPSRPSHAHFLALFKICDLFFRCYYIPVIIEYICVRS